MDLIFAYLAGVLTLINPCVLPVLPIVLARSVQTDLRAPVALAGGMALSFVLFGTGIAAIGPAFGIYPEDVIRIAALVMVGFGAVLAWPALGRRFSRATQGLASVADARMAATARALNIPRRSTLVALEGGQEIGRIVAGTSKAEIPALFDTALAAAG